MDAQAWFDVTLAVLGGAIRVGTPFLFVSLGECLTEKSGRINLGLEGVLVLSAMAGLRLQHQPQVPSAVPVNSKPWAISPMLRDVAEAPFTPKVSAGAAVSTTKMALDCARLPARSITCADRV